MEQVKNIIEQIVEANSMQPAAYYVGMDYYSYSNQKSAKVDRIVEEDVHIEGDPFAYYVGYSADNQRLFEFRKGSVNVTYRVN
jgi:hypothetical protein